MTLGINSTTGWITLGKADKNKDILNALANEAKKLGVDLDTNNDGKVDEDDKVLETLNPSGKEKLTSDDFAKAMPNLDAKISSYELSRLWNAVVKSSTDDNDNKDNTDKTKVKIEGNQTIDATRNSFGSNTASGRISVTSDTNGSIRSISIPEFNIDISSIMYDAVKEDDAGNKLRRGLESITINGINYSNSTSTFQIAAISAPDANNWCTIKNDKSEIVAKVQLNDEPFGINAIQILSGSKIRTVDFFYDTDKKTYSANNIIEYKAKSFSDLNISNIHRVISCKKDEIVTYKNEKTIVRDSKGNLSEEIYTSGSRVIYNGANTKILMDSDELEASKLPAAINTSLKGTVTIKITNNDGVELGEAIYKNGKIQSYSNKTATRNNPTISAEARYSGDTLVSYTEKENNNVTSIVNMRNNISINYKTTSITTPSLTLNKKYVPDSIDSTTNATFKIKDKDGNEIGTAIYEKGKLKSIQNDAGEEIWTPEVKETNKPKKEKDETWRLLCIDLKVSKEDGTNMSRSNLLDAAKNEIVTRFNNSKITSLDLSSLIQDIKNALRYSFEREYRKYVDKYNNLNTVSRRNLSLVKEEIQAEYRDAIQKLYKALVDNGIATKETKESDQFEGYVTINSKVTVTQKRAIINGTYTVYYEDKNHNKYTQEEVEEKYENITSYKLKDSDIEFTVDDILGY